jgi:hypothetical protein
MIIAAADQKATPPPVTIDRRAADGQTPPLKRISSARMSSMTT